MVSFFKRECFVLYFALLNILCFLILLLLNIGVYFMLVHIVITDSYVTVLQHIDIMP